MIAYFAEVCKLFFLGFLVVLALPAHALAGAQRPDATAIFLEKAGALIRESDLDSAQKVLETAKQSDPENVKVLYQLGWIAYRKRDLKSARTYFSSVVRLAPPAYHSRYFLGRIALLENLPLEASEWLEPVVSSGEPVFDAAAQLAAAYRLANQPARALEPMQSALGRAPWDGALHYQLGRIYAQLGRKPEAEEEFRRSQRLKAIDRLSVEKLLECSNLLAKDQKEAAVRLRDEILQEPQADPDALVSLGLLFATAGLSSEALGPFEAAAERDPTSFEAQYNSGLTLLKLDRARDADAYLRSALRLQPESPEANAGFGLALVLEESYTEAVPPLETAHRLQTSNVRTANLLATAYLRSGAATKAVPLLREILISETGDPKTYFLLVEALNAVQDEQGALQIAETAQRLFPESAQAQMAKAQQLARMGRYQEAGPVFAKASELAPEQVEPLLGLGEVLEKGGRFEESFRAYSRVLERDLTNVAARLGAARVLFAMQRFAEAKSLLEAALSQYAENSELHYQLSRVYERLGDSEKASEHVRILRDLRAKELGLNARP